MIKAIIFDISGVVCINGTKKFIEALNKKYGIEMNILKDLTNGTLGTQYRENKINKEKFWEEFKKITGITDDPQKMESDWIGGFKVMEDTKKIIVELKKKYKIYYLSDNAKDIALGIARDPAWNEMFDDGLYAWQAGVRKPSPEVYKMALEKAQIQPEEAVFVDDKESNLVPARELGISTIFFTTADNLQKKLTAMKVL